MAACLDHDATRAVAIYAEDVVDGRAFVAAARALAAAGKPVVLMAPGRSDGGRAQRRLPHGSLTSAHRVVDAACAAGGRPPGGQPDPDGRPAPGPAGRPPDGGPRAAIVTDGGGHGAIAADALAAVGLDTPVLDEATRGALRGVLWQNSTVANPVDLAGAGEQDPLNYVRVPSRRCWRPTRSTAC